MVIFDGFISQDGELVSTEDTERLSAIFLKTEDLDHAVGILVLHENSVPIDFIGFLGS